MRRGAAVLISTNAITFLGFLRKTRCRYVRSFPSISHYAHSKLGQTFLVIRFSFWFSRKFNMHCRYNFTPQLGRYLITPSTLPDYLNSTPPLISSPSPPLRPLAMYMGSNYNSNEYDAFGNTILKELPEVQLSEDNTGNNDISVDLSNVKDRT